MECVHRLPAIALIRSHLIYFNAVSATVKGVHAVLSTSVATSCRSGPVKDDEMKKRRIWNEQVKKLDAIGINRTTEIIHDDSL